MVQNQYKVPLKFDPISHTELPPLDCSTTSKPRNRALERTHAYVCVCARAYAGGCCVVPRHLITSVDSCNHHHIQD